MATFRAYTDLFQSKKLAEFLPLESADMYYDSYGRFPQGYACPLIYPNSFKYNNPCWSLAVLLNVLPEIQGGKPIIVLDDNYITYPHISDLHTKADNLVDACYEMIIRLHELKML